MKFVLLMTVFASVISVAIPNITLAFSGNEGPGPGVQPADACGAPYKIDYVKIVTDAAIRGCGSEMQDFTKTDGHGSITTLRGLNDPNQFYSVMVQDAKSGKTVSATIKCNVQTGKPSFLSLDFAAIDSYGGCSL